MSAAATACMCVSPLPPQNLTDVCRAYAASTCQSYVQTNYRSAFNLVKSRHVQEEGIRILKKLDPSLHEGKELLTEE